ncbi:hypothetical protein PEL8287_02408 [Roseovarius litorisediminis]|uniref:Uncharacterized protein n=1 Tax=Roseovarius litorisediminis TaxID=1312363 RepID=A0A1Y5SR23_9RHOB|nr:hypothetical protein [Roseovarius litorisediminis]SLN46455.1 hypothetical protein PEL8287_02408 [Roseovarius litorisediminis]
MYRRLFMTLAMTALAFPAQADNGAGNKPLAIQINAAQIQELLSGNTIVGTWAGSNYSQYYFENGRTIYAPEGGRPDEGKWRVRADTNQYDSWWRSTDWTPYTIVMTNDGFAWVNGENLEPFKVLKGKQGDW